VPRVIGIDPGTVSIDVCGIEDGRVFLDRSVPTAEALAAPDTLLALLDAAAPLDLVAGPSGYGLPLVAARDATETDLRLACLAAPGERGGIDAGRHPPCVGSGASEGEPDRHGDRRQGLRNSASDPGVRRSPQLSRE
jgi:hypothetical protein